MQRHPLALLCTCLLLAACGGDKTASNGAQRGEENLPKPDAASGSVTGMPNPGAPSAQPASLPRPPADDEITGVDNGDGSPFDPNPPVDPPAIDSNGDIAIPPPDTMPTMPAPTPDPIESRVIPPTES